MPTTKLRLVSSASQVRSNHAAYQQAIARGVSAGQPLIEVIPYIQSWIAVRGADGSLTFAPSKFIGYRDMTSEIYDRNYMGMDGRLTEVAIKDWVRIIKKDDQCYEQARDQLFDFCAKLGKKPNGRCRISLLLDADTETVTSKLVGLLIEVYKSLPADQQKIVRRQIANQA